MRQLTGEAHQLKAIIIVLVQHFRAVEGIMSRGKRIAEYAISFRGHIEGSRVRGLIFIPTGHLDIRFLPSV